MTLTPKQRKQVVAKALEAAKSGRPSLLRQAREARKLAYPQPRPPAKK